MKSSKKFMTRILTAALALSMVAGTGICAAAVDEEEIISEEPVVIAPAPEDENETSKLAAFKEKLEETAQSLYEKFSQTKLAQLVEIAQKIAASQKILADTYSEAADMQTTAAQQIAEIMEEAQKQAAEAEDEETAAQIMAAAQEQTAQMAEEVQAQVEQMLTEAEQTSAALLAEATEQLEEIKAEAKGKVAEIAQQLSQAAEQAEAQAKEFVAKVIEAFISRTTKYETVTDGDYVYRIAYSIKGVSAAFIDYLGEEEEITVPAYINEVPVECIMFAGKGVKSITIPETIRPLDAVSFAGAEDLENIYVDDANPYYKSIDGAVFDKSGSVLIAVPMAKEFNAPEGTLFFAPYCYAYSRMSEIKLPSTLANIVDYTFVKCENLESIDIPEGVQGIGTEAFKDCYSLKKVHIPASVETMGEDVFTGCDVDLVIELDTVDCQAYIYAKTHEIPIKCPLTASVGLETTFVEDEEYSAMPLGLPVKVTGYAEGGSDEGYKYAFYYRKVGDTKWSCKQSFKENDSVDITPAYAGLYEICVKVKDSTGAVDKIYIEILVKDSFENTSTVSAETIKKGSKVTVNCSANNDNAEFAVFYKKKADTKWIKKQDYSDNTEVTVKPAAAADYEICVKAKNLDDGTISKKYFDLTVTE